MENYSKNIAALFTHFNTSESGLSAADAEGLLARYGANELAEKKKKPAWVLFLSQFKDFMILILAAAAIVSGLLGEVTDAIIILIIIILNAVVGFVQEYRAEKAMEELKKMSITHTQVYRDGRIKLIPSGEVVPGDTIQLEAGNIVPADARIFEAHALRIDEASLTGESFPVDKTGKDLPADDLPLGDQLNMAFKGTIVTNGRAKALVVATGMNTELGKIAEMLQEEEPVTPLQKRMMRFGKNLSYIILLICAILFVTGLLRNEDPFKILLLSVSLAVAAIPEALPALITVALAIGASRLAKKNALIRKLPAVETLGSVSFICTDKTGTLTQNKMHLVQLYDHPAQQATENISMLQLGMALNHDVRFNEEEKAEGESTEVALVEALTRDISFEQYIDIAEQYPRIAELPFDSDRKCMTTVHRYNGKYLVLTKGASEAIAAMLNSNDEAALLQTKSDEWAGNGIRVLAYAYKLLDNLPEPLQPQTLEKELSFAGLTGLMDPAREEVKGAIEICKTAGITPVMITGDHPASAKSIARQIGILDEDGLAITGTELQQLQDADFLKQVEQIAVYARVSPSQKLRIVKALQQRGHFVAMTGDGVNDAPSLRAANIGVAMGITGTHVSKEAAHMILLDDNFATIVNAVKEGRRVYDNLRKFVKYIMTCNSAEIWTIFLAPWLGLPMPLLPIHILYINLVTDGLPALALATEKAEADIMTIPPRPAKESLFAHGVGYHIIWVGLLMAGLTLGTEALTTFENNNHWQTMVFTVLSLSQLGHVMAVRSERTFIFRHGLLSNLPLLGSVLLTFLLQLAVIYVPYLNKILKTQPLSLKEFGICMLMPIIIFHAVEAEKWVKTFFKKKNS